MSKELLMQPLSCLALTVTVFVAASWIYKQLGNHPLSHPVLLSIALVVAFLSSTGLPYDRYFQGVQFIHFLLGPATVALAVPMFRQLRKIRTAAVPIACGIMSGSAAGVAFIVTLCLLRETDPALISSLVTKSVKSPVAMGIAPQSGGIPALAAIASISAGVVGATFGPALLNRLGITEPLARGLAMGVASHGLGTARILQEGEEAGAAAGVGMGLTALVMAIVMPALAQIWLAPG